MSTVIPLASQLSPHRAERVELPGRYGPIAALRTSARGTSGRRFPGHPHPVALMVPGFTGSKEDFAPLLDPISESGIDAIAIDLPGQYESNGPDDESAYLPRTLGIVIAELIGKLAAEGHDVLLMGHSYGGLVARAATLAEAPLLGLTLMGSGPGELPEGARRQALDLGVPAMREHGVAGVMQLLQLVEERNPDFAARPAELREFMRTRFRRTKPAALLGMAEGLRSEPDLVGSLSRRLHSSGTPALVVCGADDDAWSMSAQRDMADRLDADFAVILHARHSPNVENPDGLLDTLLPTWRTWLTA